MPRPGIMIWAAQGRVAVALAGEAEGVGQGMRHMTRIGSRALAVLAVLTLQACNGDDVVGPRPPVDIVFATIIQGSYWSWAGCDSSAAGVLMFADEGLTCPR